MRAYTHAILFMISFSLILLFSCDLLKTDEDEPPESYAYLIKSDVIFDNVRLFSTRFFTTAPTILCEILKGM